MTLTLDTPMDASFSSRLQASRAARAYFGSGARVGTEYAIDECDGSFLVRDLIAEAAMAERAVSGRFSLPTDIALQIESTPGVSLEDALAREARELTLVSISTPTEVLQAMAELTDENWAFIAQLEHDQQFDGEPADAELLATIDPATLTSTVTEVDEEIGSPYGEDAFGPVLCVEDTTDGLPTDVEIDTWRAQVDAETYPAPEAPTMTAGEANEAPVCSPQPEAAGPSLVIPGALAGVAPRIPSVFGRNPALVAALFALGNVPGLSSDESLDVHAWASAVFTRSRQPVSQRPSRAPRSAERGLTRKEQVYEALRQANGTGVSVAQFQEMFGGLASHTVRGMISHFNAAGDRPVITNIRNAEGHRVYTLVP